MKVLVTGGCGFIGSHVVEQFQDEGHDVYIIDNLSAGDRRNVKTKNKIFKMNVESERCEEVFLEIKFDIVVHLAAHIDAAYSIEDPIIDAQANVMGVVNMLNLAAKYKVKKFVFASSAAVYGDNSDIPLVEDNPCNAMSPYGISKYSGEKYCELWFETYGLNTVALRFANVFGPRQSIKGEGGIIAILLKNIYNNTMSYVYGDGEQTRDFIYVGDVADAVYKASLAINTGVYNVSLMERTSVNQIVEIIKKNDENIEVYYTKPRKGDIRHSSLSNEKLKKELRWGPKTTVEEGLNKTYYWYKEYMENS